MNTEKMIIIGSGPAGLTAGIYGARAQLQPLIFEGQTPGGQLMGTTYVDNWPSIPHILGPQLMASMKQQTQELGARFTARNITRVNFSGDTLIVSDNKNQEYHTHSLIIASGATPKRLGCTGEDQYWGKGVSTCAVCDGAFYKDKAVVIVGGGDTAMENASFMTNFTKSITVIHILDALTASASMQERVLNDPAITIRYNSVVSAITGDGTQVTGLEVTDKKTGERSPLPTNVVFIAIGSTPNTAPFKDHIELDSHGYIVLQKLTHTSKPGVFAAGDVADYRYRQAIASAGAGCMAALDAERFLKEHKR